MIYKVTAFFNEWLGRSTTRSEELSEDEVLARSRERIPMLQGYREGDPLIESETGEITTPDLEVSIEGEDPEELSRMGACEALFTILNHDDRSNGKTERSLSVGDVVRVRQDGEEREYWYAVANIGFTAIEPPNGMRR